MPPLPRHKGGILVDMTQYKCLETDKRYLGPFGDVAEPGTAKMQSVPDMEHQKSQDSGLLTPHTLWSVDLKLTHLDWSPEATLIHFQAQYPTTCELDYNILQKEIQLVPKTKAPVDVGEFCLVEDLTSACWFRGRVQSQNNDLFDVFLVDYGNVLSVDITHIASCSNELFNLPPKIVCGFLANVLLQNCSHSAVDGYLSSLKGRNISGFIQALLPHKVLLFEAPDINCELVRHGFGRLMDTDTFLLLVSLLTEVPLKQNIEPVPDLLIEKSKVQRFSLKLSSLQGFLDVFTFCGPKLSCGTRADVRITAAVNPGLFYCQMAREDADLRQMSRKLAMVCERSAKEPSQSAPGNLGVLCAVKGKDEKWYRGFVHLLPISSQVRVFFIDYGFFDFVKIDQVHRLPPEFYSAPMRALPCSLPSLTDLDVKAQQLDFLKAGLLGAVLKVEIKGFDKEQHLYTVTVLGSDTHVEEPEPAQNLPTQPALEAEEKSPLIGFANYMKIMDEACNKMLEVEKLQAASTFVGYVVHAENPNHFWVRTQKRNEEFEEMMSQIAKHFSEVELDKDTLQNPEVGAVCCALYEKDMHFYRGVVMEVLDHGAEILFTDFGNVEKVPHMLIKKLPKTLAKKPPFAVCCTLSNIFPLEEVWTSASCDFFRTSVSDQSLIIHLVQIKKHKCVVELFEMGSKKRVTELLVSSRLVDYIPEEAVKQKGKNQTKETRQHSAATHESRKSEQWGSCEEDNDVSTTETSKVTHNFKALNIKPGFEFLVSCSNIRSPSDFWCQRQDQGPALEKLMDDLQSYYSAPAVAVPLQPGEASCVAKSPQDGKWYRGLIKENRKGSATVMLVDFGSVIKVRENHLQMILPEYVHLERQAFRCSLYSQTEQDWSPELSDLLKDFVLKNTEHLKCQVFSQINVKNKGLWNVVHLYNAQTQESITDTLLEPGLANTRSTTHELDMIPESFVYSSFGLRSGTEEQVYVSYISSQCELFCHLERNTEIIDELEKKISEESEKMKQAGSGAVVEKLCLAKYLDGKWYRGWMLPVQLPLHISVFFVDYGNINIMEKTKVMFIPKNCEDLLFTPMQAVRCNLYLVPKEELYADVKEWLNNTIMNKLLRAVVQAKREDGSIDVELFDGEVSINEKVKELILSLTQKPKPVRLESKTHKKTRYTKKTTKGKNPPSVPTSDVSKGSTPKKTKGRITSSNKKANGKQQNETNRRRSTSVKPPAKSELKQSPDERSNNPAAQQKETKSHQQLCFLEKDISPGFRAKCFVSHVDSVSSFFLQLSDDEPGIFKMAEDLSSGVFRKMASSFQVGEVVLAEFEEDGALYRSVVKKKEGSSCFQVEFVDYGNSAVVEKEKMYLLPEEFTSQPRFSIPCLLLDTKTYEDDASFIDAVLEKPLNVDFVSQRGSQWQVKLEVLEDGHDAAPESSTLTNQEPPPSAPEANEVISCELKLGEQGFLNEDVTESSTVEGGHVNPEPKPVKVSVKRKVITVRRFRQTHSRIKSHRKTKIFSVKVLKEDPDVLLRPAVLPRDTENGTILSVQSDGSFYVGLAKNEGLLTALEKRIVANLNKYETVAEADVKPGLKCLVQILDNVWQRAVVQHTSEGKFKIFLVDHGITKDIPSGSILQQSPDLIKFSKLALLCRLNSFDFAPQDWDPSLHPLIGTQVQLMFVSYTEPGNFWVVEVVMKDLSLILQSKVSHQQNKDPPAETQTAPQQLLFAPVETDKAYSGFAAAVSTPFQFCVVLEDLLLIMNQTSTMFASLPSEMPSLPKAHLVPGTCCLLETESKKTHCRAEIVHADTTIVLNLVDDGHYECIPYHDYSKLKKLPADLTSQPKVIYPCVLQGVMPISGDGQWTDEAAVFFQDCLCQKNLQIFFRESVSNSEWRVDIFDDDIDVANKLVEAGHAVYTEVMLGLRFERGLCKPEDSDSEEEEDEAEPGEQSNGAKSRSSQCLLM